MSSFIRRTDPTVVFEVHVKNLVNNTDLRAESVSVFTRDFSEVADLLKKFHEFIDPISQRSMGLKPQPPEFRGPVCKGSIVLGSACGQCERCVWEREQMEIRNGK